MKVYRPGDRVPLKWYNFLRVFFLVLNLLSLLMRLLDLRLIQYRTPEAWTVYNTMDLVFNLVSVVLTVAIFLLLRRHSWKGIQLYLFLLVLSAGYSFLCMALCMAAYHVAWASYAGTLVGNTILLVLNSIYFKKRKPIFVPVFVGYDKPAPVPVTGEEDIDYEDYDLTDEEMAEAMEKYNAEHPDGEKLTADDLDQV